MSKLVIKGGTVVDTRGIQRADVAILDGEIVEVAESIDATGVQKIDASGCVVSPGLVDLHTHLREPGRESAETVETGARAAALGGYTAIVAMPNTEPTIDNASVVRHIQHAAIGVACDVAVAASISVGRKGERLSPMAELAALGVRIFTDDGDGLQSAGLMRRALEYASALDVTIAQHCEDSSLSAGGHMHEGEVSANLGISGIPTEAEEVMVMRDVALARLTGARVHFLHLSTAGSVAIVAAARQQGLNITAEAAPHHFTLTDEALRTFDPAFKVNPPLRSETHRQAVMAGLRNGTIDAIATDHAPHVAHLKEAPLAEAPCGMLGLETALALAITELELPIEQVLALMSWQPARIARLDATHGGPIAPGRPANIAVIDPEAEWVVDKTKLASKASNTPYNGRKLKGRVRHTLLRGDLVVHDGEAQR